MTNIKEDMTFPIFGINLLFSELGIFLYWKDFFYFNLGDQEAGMFSIGIRYEKYAGGIYLLSIHLGFWEWKLIDPGELIEEDILDPLEERITKDFYISNPHSLRRDHIVLHTGVRHTFFSKHRDIRNVFRVWIPDPSTKHLTYLTSFGISYRDNEYKKIDVEKSVLANIEFFHSLKKLKD